MSATSTAQPNMLNGYYVLRFTAQRPPGVPESGIILLAALDTVTWKSFALYQMASNAPFQTHVYRQIFSNGLEWSTSPIKSMIESAEYLMYQTEGRVLVPQNSIEKFDKWLLHTKPLYDEHSMLFTASDKAKGVLLRKENFGTWADSVLNTLERKMGIQGFVWKARSEVEQDSSVPDFALQYVPKGQAKQETNGLDAWDKEV